MPATSRAQFGYMRGIASGSIPAPKGLTKAKAAEYTAGQSPKGLPDYASRTIKHYEKKKGLK